jgi:hypothetical protein
MTVYNVGIVAEELRDVWSEYWDRNEPTERASQAFRDGLLDRSVDVEADSPAEAMAKAVADNPGFVALRDSVQRIDPLPAERLDS